MKINVIGVAAALLIMGSVYPQPGSLDNSFDLDGKVVSSIYPHQNMRNLTIQPDGKIVSVGLSRMINEDVDVDFCIMRHNPDGSLDNTFGTAGGVHIDIEGLGGWDTARAVSIQPDGKIVVAGFAETAQMFTSPKAAVVRLNDDGTLDSNFGIGGIVEYPLSNWQDRFTIIDAVTLQPDGKIVIAGNANYNTTGYDFVFARLNTNGGLDTSFGSAGVTHIDVFNAAQQSIQSVIIQDDGKILALGLSDDIPATMRLTADGIPDVSYFGTGIKLYSGSSGLLLGKTALQADGKLLVAFNTTDTSTQDIGLMRFGFDGSPDPIFGTEGLIVTDIVNTKDEPIKTLVQPDGKIIVVAFTDISNVRNFSVLRYTSTGVLDTAFSDDGKLVTSLGSNTSSPSAAILQADGKLLVGGNYGTSGVWGFALARYNTGLNLGADAHDTVSVSVSPNPANNLITICGLESRLLESYSIVDMLGKVVLSGNFKEETLQQLDISGLAKGTYVIKSDAISQGIKFIKN